MICMTYIYVLYYLSIIEDTCINGIFRKWKWIAFVRENK